MGGRTDNFLCYLGMVMTAAYGLYIWLTKKKSKKITNKRLLHNYDRDNQ